MLTSVGNLVRVWLRGSKVWLPTLVALGSLILVLARAYDSNAWDEELNKAASGIRQDIQRLEESSKRAQVKTYEDITQQQNEINAKLTSLIEMLRRRVEGQEIAGQIADLMQQVNEIVRQQRALPAEQQWQLDELLSVKRQELSGLIQRKLSLAPLDF